MVVSTPKKRADVRILGLDASILPKEVALSIAEAGGCEAGEVKVGALRRRSQGDSHTVWAQCPAEAAKKLADKGKLRVGWISARVEALKSRSAICFKCMASGHMAKECPSGKGSAELCFNCGRPGHRARNCTARPRCPACEKAGRNADHRFGGRACTTPPSRMEVGSLRLGRKVPPARYPGMLHRRRSLPRERRLGRMAKAGPTRQGMPPPINTTVGTKS